MLNIGGFVVERVVPEPSSMALIGIAIAVSTAFRKKKHNA